MAIRKDIVWTVSEDGETILPATPQDGGVQGEDNAVRAKFVFGATHPLVIGGYRLYIECVDPVGGHHKTDVLIPDHEGAIAAAIPLAWTRYGGTIRLNVMADGERDRIILDSRAVTFRPTRRLQYGN